MAGSGIRPRRAYLLRCWQEGEALPGEEAIWRFSLEELGRERHRYGFGDLQELMAFLRTELMDVPQDKEEWRQ